MQIRQRFRGLLGISLVWGMAISAIGTAFMAVYIMLAARAGGSIPGVVSVSWTQWASLLARVAIRDFGFGCATGALFALLLAATEQRRNVATLSLRRVGVWGFLASALPVAITTSMSAIALPAAVITAATVASGLMGVGLAVGMVRLARRGGAVAAAAATESAVPVG